MNLRKTSCINLSYPMDVENYCKWRFPVGSRRSHDISGNTFHGIIVQHRFLPTNCELLYEELSYRSTQRSQTPIYSVTILRELNARVRQVETFVNNLKASRFYLKIQWELSKAKNYTIFLGSKTRERERDLSTYRT